MLTEKEVAEAMKEGIALSNVIESKFCFIKLSSISVSLGNIKYEVGPWGAVFCILDGSPEQAKLKWMQSGYRENIDYISKRSGIHVESVQALRALHATKNITEIIKLLKKGEIVLVKI